MKLFNLKEIKRYDIYFKHFSDKIHIIVIINQYCYETV